MSLRRRGPNEDWEFVPATDRVRVIAWETLPLGRMAVVATAIVMAYFVLTGSFSSGQVSLDTGDACEKVLLRDEAQKIQGNDPRRGSDAYGQCLRPTATPVPDAPAPTHPATVPYQAPASCQTPGYSAALLNPIVPGAAETYVYVIDGCHPPGETYEKEGLDYVKLSGCWQVQDIANVYSSAGTAELKVTNYDYVMVSGISDADLPLTIEVTFQLALKSGPDRTWVWVHTGRS